MDKKYISTRGNQKPLNFYEAILQGIGSDGGLLVPDFTFNKKDLKALSTLSYVDLATEVISEFTPDGTKEEVRELCQSAYGNGLFPQTVVPVEKAGNVYVAELFQGPTAAFKDMALSLLPYFMTWSLKKMGETREVVILTATSGDTGKAALEGFKDVKGTSIKVFYPNEGVSPIQEKQMVTQTGNNVDVIAINGNFDDAQTAVKKAFNSEELKALCADHNVFLSSANSINIGRLIPQIVYYFYSYFRLVENNVLALGDPVNFTVPSGNFGNCLAGYIAKLMGLPVNQFVIASNKNNILTDFFNTGVYDANREFYKTNAPAMDILVSSNLERLVYFFEKDATVVKGYMDALNKDGVYKVSEDTYKAISKEFKAGCQDEAQVLVNVENCYKDTGYLLDTHTAVGYGVYQNYVKDTNDTTPTVLLATASPYKFPQDVYKAIAKESLNEYDAIDALNSKTNVKVPTPLVGIKDREVLHTKVIDKTEIISFVSDQIKEL